MTPGLLENADWRTKACRADPRARRAFDITSVGRAGGEVSVSERQLLDLPFADLLAFSRRGSGCYPILVVAPLAGGFPILLRDLVLGLLQHSATVAVTDWFDARYVPRRAGRFGLEDNINHVLAMIRALGSPSHLVAVCQGVVPALAATALLSADEPAAAPCSLTLMGGPVDAFIQPTRIAHLVRSRPRSWFEANVIEAVPVGYPGEGRLVYPKTLQLQALTAYMGSHIAQGRELLWKLLNDDGEDPIRFPFWSLAATLMDLPAEFFLENLEAVFQDQALSRGSLRIGGRTIEFGAIGRTALMTLEGDADDVVSPGQTRAAHALCRSIPDRMRRHVAVPHGGHFSLFHGGICRSSVVPEIGRFVRRAERRAVCRGMPAVLS